jgi:hypothetical protein
MNEQKKNDVFLETCYTFLDSFSGLFLLPNENKAANTVDRAVWDK